MDEYSLKVSQSAQTQGGARTCKTYLIRYKANRKVACGALRDFAGMLALSYTAGTETRAFATTTVNINIAAV